MDRSFGLLLHDAPEKSTPSPCIRPEVLACLSGKVATFASWCKLLQRGLVLADPIEPDLALLMGNSSAITSPRLKWGQRWIWNDLGKFHERPDCGRDISEIG